MASGVRKSGEAAHFTLVDYRLLRFLTHTASSEGGQDPDNSAI